MDWRSKSWVETILDRQRVERVVDSLLMVGLSLGVGVPAISFAQPSSLRQISSTQEANPFLSFLPVEVEPDFAAWRSRLADAAASRPSRRVAATYQEREVASAQGLNDVPATAELLPIVAPEELLLVRGQVLTDEIALGDLAIGGADVGGSIPTALPLGPVGVATGARFVGDGMIGDGAFGSAGTASGDFDVFLVSGLAGQRLSVLVETPQLLAGLDPFVAVANSDGDVLEFSDAIIEGGFFVSSDAALSVRLPLDDDYFIVVGGSDPDGGLFPADPFDPGSGPGVFTEGDYRLHLDLDSRSRASRDLFALDLEPGDVIAATVREGEDHRIGLLDASGALLVSSRFDLSGLYPAASRLPAGGDASIAHIAVRSGRYFLSVEAASEFAAAEYGIEVGVFPAAGDATREPATTGRVSAASAQGLFIDFDGATVDRNAFFSLPPGSPDLVSLSGLSNFLGRWGLAPSQESAVIGAVLAEVEDQLREEVRFRGINGDFATSGALGEFGIEIRNSRDHVQRPQDARVVVGGTIDELRLQTIGIAEAIDPGNFEPVKTAVVLLDLLSAEPSSPNSLNGVELGSGSSMVELIGTAVGRIVAHEAGHLFGNFHTERDVGPTTIMDSGGRLDRILGVGEDGVFGSADDVRVVLDTDEYSRREAFRGTEQTLEVVSLGLPVGVGPSLRVAPSAVLFGSVVPPGSSSSVMQSSVMQTVELRNDGGEAVTVVALVAPGSAFSLDSPGPFDLFPGQSVLVPVRFSPPTVGVFEAELELETRFVGSTDRRNVPLQGMGGAGVLATSVSGVLELPAIVYGPLATTAGMLTVRNSGTAPLDLQWTVRGAQADRFAVASVERSAGARVMIANTTRLADAASLADSVRIEPGQSRDLLVAFDPAGAIGEATAQLFLSDALGGAAPLVMALHARSDGPDVSIEPRPYAFGALRADGASGRREFRLRNEGTLPLSVTRAVLRPGTPIAFTLTPPTLPRVLAPQEQIGVNVVFEPTNAVRYDGFLDVESGDPEEPLAEVEMVGFGLLPMIEVSPRAITVGEVPAGGSVVRTLRVDNVGGATLRGSFELSNGANGANAFGVWSVTPAPGSLTVGPESFFELTVTYDAAPQGAASQGAISQGVRSAGVGPSTAELRFVTDDRDRPEVLVPLRQGSVLAIPSAGPLGWAVLALILALCGVHACRR